MCKIAFITSMLVGGGQERVTANLANELSKSSDRTMYVITGEKQENEYHVAECINRVCLLTGHFFNDVKTLKMFLKHEQIDIAVSMGLYTNFVLSASNFNLNTKVIISERNAPKQDNISWRSKLFRFIFYRFSDGYVFQTKEAQSFYSKNIQKRSWIIPNPVKSDLPYRNKEIKKKIVSIGRLAAQKNYYLLLDAVKIVFQSHPEYTLHIYGKGELETELKKYSIENGLDNSVIFEGYSTDVHNAIKECDIYVMSSDFEGMPNTLMEAMAMGFPVISTNCPCGGPLELITHKKNGLLVSVKNVTELANAIIFLIENHKIKESISIEAKSVREKYSIEKISEKWLQAFEEIKWR